jgi:peptide deformylase
MALRTIYTVEHPVLRRKAKKVSRFDAYIERLVHDMFETMRAAPGVGLAGPQIGESIRVLVAEYEDESVALVNPEIIKRSDETLLGTEGCLSIPGIVGEDVPRAAAVTVKARNPHGKEVRISAEGWFARILQHEIDHLDGILFTDRIPPEQIREVQDDEVVQEAEVETSAPPKGAKGGNGANGAKSGRTDKNGAALRPEHNERPAAAGNGAATHTTPSTATPAPTTGRNGKASANGAAATGSVNPALPRHTETAPASADAQSTTDAGGAQ